MFKKICIKEKSKKIVGGCLLLVLAVFLLFSPINVLAQGVNAGVDYGENIGLGNLDPRVVAANIVRVALGFLAIIVVILIIYAGFVWMTSEGDEAKITQAKKIIKNAVIGLIIILASFGITTFLINKFLEGTIGGPGGPGGPGGGGGGIPALGSGIIESHYPARDQRNLPRNTSIFVTFKEPMNAGTIIVDTNGSGILGDWIDSNGDGIYDDGEYDRITNNILLYKTIDGSDGPFVTDVFASLTADNKTFRFKPVQYLGNSSEYIWYSVALGTGIRKQNGDNAFPGVIGNIGYDWSFEVGTYVDLIPPRIQSIIPRPGAIEPRNIVIQINFNEAIDPISASGETTNGFDNLEVHNETMGGVLVDGIYYISNQYRTVEFLTNDDCGVNSCNETIYCLPASSELRILVKAASLLIIGEPTAVFPFDGVADMASNSLDGNADSTAEGPISDCDLSGLGSIPICVGSGDNAFWIFNTNDTIDISAPLINAINPGIGQSGVSLDTSPEATFSKYLMSASLNTTSITMTNNPSFPLNYWINKSDDSGQTTVYIRHDPFNEDTDYTPRYNSGIRDIYQNCYSPASGMGCTGGPSCCEGVTDGGTSCP